MSAVPGPRPIGRAAALDGAEHQLQVLEFVVGECRRALAAAAGDPGDERAAGRACLILWAMHLIPLAAHRMLQDYCAGAEVDHRPEAGAGAEAEAEGE